MSEKIRVGISGAVTAGVNQIAFLNGVRRNELIECWLAQILIAYAPGMVAEIDEKCGGAINLAANYKPDLEIEVKFPNAP